MRIPPGLQLPCLPAILAGQSANNCVANVVSYDIVYVRAPRPSGGYGTFPDVSRPLVAQPGTDLRRLHPDCIEELLFPRPQDQPIVDAPLETALRSIRIFRRHRLHVRRDARRAADLG